MVSNDFLSLAFMNFWFVTVLIQNIKMTFRPTPLLKSEQGEKMTGSRPLRKLLARHFSLIAAVSLIFSSFSVDKFPRF